MSEQPASANEQEKPELSKKELKAQKKAQKKAEKEAKKKGSNKKEDPVKIAMRNLYRLFMAMAFALVVWLGYEAFLIISANIDLGQ